MNYNLPRQAGKTTHLLKTAEKLLSRGESVVYICHTHNEAERLKRLWSEMHSNGYYCRGVISFVTMLDVVGCKQFAEATEPLKVLIDEPMQCLEGLITIKPQFEIVDTAGTYDLHDHIVTREEMVNTMTSLLGSETDSDKKKIYASIINRL